MFSPLNDPQVEQWFQCLNAPLKRLPAEERAELHAEVRQHLEALAAANEELGSSPEEAWRFALTQFGDPSKFGRRMAWEWRRGQGWISPDMAAVLHGIGIAVVAFFSVTMMVCVSCIAGGWGAFINQHGEAVFGTAYMLAVPIFSGYVVGRKHPRQALTGAFYSAALLPILPGTAFMEAACFLGHERLGVTLGVNLILFVLGSIWLLLSGAAAYLASVTKRGWYRPSWADFKITLPSRRRQVG